MDLKNTKRGNLAFRNYACNQGQIYIYIQIKLGNR